MKEKYNKEIMILAQRYKRTEEDKDIRELLSGQLIELADKSARGEIAISDFTEELKEITSQAEWFMRLIK